jgi:hypothetical protein
MTVRRCSCGATPRVRGGWVAGLPFVRLQCACGRQGARIVCHDLTKLPCVKQAAVDGWNLVQ